MGVKSLLQRRSAASVGRWREGEGRSEEEEERTYKHARAKKEEPLPGQGGTGQDRKGSAGIGQHGIAGIVEQETREGGMWRKEGVER